MWCRCSLVARVLWRIQKDTGLVSDTQLSTLDLLEDHLSKIPPEDLKELKVDVQHFYNYWPKKSKPVGEDYVAHLFGVVGTDSSTYEGGAIYVTLEHKNTHTADLLLNK